MRIIDTHAHFHDPNWPDGLVWPKPDAHHFRTCLPENYKMEIGVRSVIAIETSMRAVDDKRLAEIARDSDIVKCYINNMQPLEAYFDQRVREVRNDSKWRGIRLRPIDVYNLRSKELLKSLEQLENLGHIELGIRDPFRLEQLSALCRDLPNINFVLTHCGHPKFAGNEIEFKYDQIEGLSNLFIKISPPPDIDVINPEVQKQLSAHILRLNNVLSADRLMFGSNWPGCQDSVKFQNWLCSIFANKSSDLEKIFNGTASDLYLTNDTH